MASNDTHLAAVKCNDGFEIQYLSNTIVTRFGVSDGITFVKYLDRVLQTDSVRNWYFQSLGAILSGGAKVDRTFLDGAYLICKTFSDSFDEEPLKEYIGDDKVFKCELEDVRNVFFLATFVKLMAPILNSGKIETPEKVGTAALNYMAEKNNMAPFLAKLRDYIHAMITKLSRMTRFYRFSMMNCHDLSLYMYDIILSNCLIMYDYDVDPFARIGSKIKLKGLNLFSDYAGIAMVYKKTNDAEPANAFTNITDKLFSGMTYRYIGEAVTKRYLIRGEYRLDVTSVLDRRIYSMITIPMYNDIFGLNASDVVYSDTQLKMIHLFLYMSMTDYITTGNKNIFINNMIPVMYNMYTGNGSMAVTVPEDYRSVFCIDNDREACDKAEIKDTPVTGVNLRESPVMYVKNYGTYGICNYLGVIGSAMTLFKTLVSSNPVSPFVGYQSVEIPKSKQFIDGIHDFVGAMLGNSVKEYEEFRTFVRTKRRLTDKG